MNLTRNEKRYLAKFTCSWCDHRLDQEGCSAVYGQCDEQTKEQRRVNCLANYKPRTKKIGGK
jgi:hypothetical protein